MIALGHVWEAVDGGVEAGGMRVVWRVEAGSRRVDGDGG